MQNIFFPHIPLNKFNIFKDENSFGFRMQEDFYKLKEKKPDVKTIAFFGGSGAYDIYNKIPFSFQIEQKLKQKGLSVNVLNFAVINSTILDSINIYTIFAYQLPLDLVIFYGGMEDIKNGIFISDEYIKNNIIYSDYYIKTAQQLYNQNLPMHINNSPKNILKILSSKINQFKKLTLLNGSKFMFVLQPINNKKDNFNMFKKIEIVFEQAYSYLDMKYINLYKIFSNKTGYFADSYHLNKKGNNKVVNILLPLIEKKLTEEEKDES